MATPGATIAERIEDLIGADYATVPSLSYKDLINAAFNEVADMLSVDLLMKYSAASQSVTSAASGTEGSGYSIEDKKILKVTRVDANSNGIERECELVDRVRFSESKDTNSIYNATVYSPVYNVNGNTAAAEVLIFPHCNDTGQSGRIFYFAYATNSTDLTAITAATLNTSHFLPSNLIHAIVLKACINILTSYISNQVQDEEDTEMLQLITSQLQSLQASFQAEMTRYVDPQKATGGE